MKNRILIMMMLLIGMTASAQINMEDTTAQVVSYWEKGEKQIYSVTLDMFRLEDSDTTFNEILTYDVEITVLTADEDSYTVEWHYKNAVTNSHRQAVKSLLLMINDKKVVIKTDEHGVFQEVLNWKDVKVFIQNARSKIRQENYNDPDRNKKFLLIGSIYSTKEYIETTAIRDILQFHNFHGGKYKLGEVIRESRQQPNPYSTEPFDTEVTVLLDTINVVENNFTLTTRQKINSTQLAETTYNYLLATSHNMMPSQPSWKDVKDMSSETYISSVIHTTGLLLYSSGITTVTNGTVIDIDETTIELK